MKNTIFKSYTKKILRSEAFVSIIIVFVLALGIIGTSYALYMDVDTDTDYQLVEVGDLAIGFDNGESIINLTNMVPMDDDIALKSTDNVFSFYIYNTGNYTANYDIKLEVLEDSNQVDTQYINYQFCKDNAQNCEDIKKLSDGNLIYTDELTPNSEDIYNKGAGSAYYFLRIWIDSEYKITEAKNISLKVTVDAKNASGLLDNKNTLAGAILNNPNIKINNTIPDFSTAETEEKGLYKAQDDHGVSYYFRGAQSYNYVNFAGMCWRIVRIEGDGSVKLILEDQYTTCNDTETEITSAVYTGNWNIGEANFGYDDIKYSDKNIASYLEPVTKADKSMIKVFYDFQANKLVSYLGKLKSGNWCYNDVPSTNFVGDIVTDKESYYNGTNAEFRYDSTVRLYSINSPKEPTLKCIGTKLDSFKSVIYNDIEIIKEAPMYVSAITADEIFYTGTGTGSYLFNQYFKSDDFNYQGFWTLSLAVYTMRTDFPYSLSKNGTLNEDGSVSFPNFSIVRPLVSLKSSTLATTNSDTETHGQPGSQTNPYVIN